MKVSKRVTNNLLIVNALFFLGKNFIFALINLDSIMTEKKKKRWIWIWIVLAVFLVLLRVAGYWLRTTDKAIPTASRGTLEVFPQFKSQHVPPRDIAVWLPSGYQPGDSCDVLYMHDGNMLFDATTTWNQQEWRVDEIMDSLIQAGAIRPCIVVGISNTDDRLTEYFPAKSWQYVPEVERDDAKLDRLTADAYLRFIVEELKPYIDEGYKPLTTREHTFMMGSSMGGLISLYALCEYPQVFGGVACLSSHLSMAHLPGGLDGDLWATAFRDYVGQHLPDANGSLIYMDHGTRDFDADYGRYQQLLDSVITGKGWDKAHYVSRVYPGHRHRETSWAARLDQPLLFLLGR